MTKAEKGALDVQTIYELQQRGKRNYQDFEEATQKSI